MYLLIPWTLLQQMVTIRNNSGSIRKSFKNISNAEEYLREKGLCTEDFTALARNRDSEIIFSGTFEELKLRPLDS